MRYHVTVTTRDGQELTMEIVGRETLEATLRCIERERRANVALPTLYWVTLEGKHWCLAPAELVGEIQVVEQQLEVAAG